jgi:hypothetical protein
MSDVDFKKTQLPIIIAIAAQGKNERAEEELLERQNIIKGRDHEYAILL